MKFGCCAKVEEIDALVRTGYTFTEFPGKEIAAMTENDFVRLAKKMKQYGLSCVGFNAYCPKEIVIAGAGYDREATKAYARLLAERGSHLGIRQIGVGSPFSRYLPLGYDRKLAFTQVREFIMDSAEILNPKGIKVGLEALAGCYCNCVNTCEEALRIIQSADNPGVGLILDFYNMERQGEADRELDSLIPYILHTHISDDDHDPFRRAALKPERYAIHLKRLLRLQEAGYTGTVNVEMDLPLNDAELLEMQAFFKTFENTGVRKQ